MSGFLELERADVRWFLSVEQADVPFETTLGRKTTFRSISVDGTEVEFTESFNDLHTAAYHAVLSGEGFGIEDARRSIELVHAIRTAPVQGNRGTEHPFLSQARYQPR